ncbi:MAG TPA: 4'-phosphopantetheinyl transferase superfamily protein [Steroidobacteraceae bacterium]|nr:4'-phosphopantetheinyl transferase superfamily protein [Steroidobacteraceae bacterium]
MSETGPISVSSAVEVWIARDSLLDAPGVGARLAQLLAPEELARRDRMAFENGKRQQLLTRAMLREALSRSVPEVAPREWRFLRGPGGRPALAPPFDSTGLDFNVAHSRGLVAAAIARAGRVGVDVETLGERVPLHVASRYFAPREVAALQALPEAEQPRRFLRLWTLKEAYLKATGEGLAGGLDSVTFSLDAGDIGFESAAEPCAARWQFREFAAADHLLAVAHRGATAGAPGAMQLREYSAGSG